jgi:hypothetical protein
MRMTWWQDPTQLRQAVELHGSLGKAAKATGANLHTLKKWSIKHLHDGHPITTASVRQSKLKDSPTPLPAPTTPALADPNLRVESSNAYLADSLAPTPEELVRSKGLDPNDWEITPTIKEWQALAPEGEIVVLRQTICHLRRRVPLDVVMPARTDAPLKRTRIPRRIQSATKPILVALPSDQHCPHDDKGLRACWLAWLERNQPERIIGLGDILNLSKPSRHRANLGAKHNDTAAENYQAGHDWWRETIDAAPGASCEQLCGNHDVRASIATLERLPELYDVRRPGEEHPWHDLEYMLGLDKLGVKYHRPEGEYHSVEVFVTENFSVGHGAKAGPYGGAPRDASKHEGSRAVGHSHKASIVVVVRYRNGRAIQHVHMSVPTMARRDLGYADTPDSHQGFSTLTIQPDGTWNVELALYDDHRQQLWWRDQMYRA